MLIGPIIEGQAWDKCKSPVSFFVVPGSVVSSCSHAKPTTKLIRGIWCCRSLQKEWCRDRHKDFAGLNMPFFHLA